MKPLFYFRRNDQKQKPSNTSSVARYFLKAWQKIQTNCCRWLSRKTAHYTVRQATIALIAFCFAFVSISLSVTLAALDQGYPVTGTGFYSRTLFALPQHEIRPHLRLVSDSVLQHVRSIQQWLDRLACKDSTAYRNFIDQHPTLPQQIQWLDSLHQNENADLWYTRKSR